MSMHRSDQRRRLAAEQAAEWLVALQSDKPSARERGEFVDWLRESPLHVAEMLRLSRVDQSLGDYTKWHEIEAAESSGDDNVVTLGDAKLSPPGYKPNRATFLPWASAASLVTLAILGAWLFLSHDQSVIRTQAGERRELTLADGSVVDVAPSTELSVRMEDTQRLIKLTRGQAFFHVAKNPNRPFIVDAGDTHVRAVGTAFNVTRSAAGVTVTVVEGQVAVIREPSSVPSAIASKTSRSADILLSANEQVLMTPAAATPVREVNGAAEVAWTVGNLVFNDETVAEVVRRFNLYNHAQIQILDQALAARRVSGVFEATDPESFIAFVRSTADEASDQHDVIRLDAPAQ